MTIAAKLTESGHWTTCAYASDVYTQRIKVLGCIKSTRNRSSALESQDKIILRLVEYRAKALIFSSECKIRIWVNIPAPQEHLV